MYAATARCSGVLSSRSPVERAPVNIAHHVDSSSTVEMAVDHVVSLKTD
jgi:hypothetical protein